MTSTKSPRVWFITGCSTGFGRHLAEASLAQGDRVIVTARKVEQIHDLEIKYPETAKAVRLDVTDKENIHEAVRIGLKTFGRIDVLVNNAGYGLNGAVEELTDQQIRDQFETNFFGLLNVTREVIPLLRKQGSGNIINVSSIGGRYTFPTMALYHASKFAVEGLSESLAQELNSFGIKVTIIEPGGFTTDFISRSLVSSKPMPEYDFFREQVAKLLGESSLGDPAVGVQAILKVVELPDPPVRLPIGPGAFPLLVEKLTADIEEYKRFEDIWEASTANATKV
jgi:NAD(P)-dependent dehydrogenase (short-subunit alcohol dehydrogenase family)